MSKFLLPYKRYGQNFLTNKHLAEKIVDILGITSEDVVLEIGSGTGILTRIIYRKRCKRFIALEVDPRLTERLRGEFNDQIIVLQEDILSFSIRNLFNRSGYPIKIIGNIPYYITSPIIFKILENSEYISMAVIMVQKEVAERLMADINTKQYGILSVMVRCQANVQIIFSVDKGNFFPIPRVDSAVISLTNLKKNPALNNYELFKKIVQATFNMRRKMIRNSLKKIMTEEQVRSINSVSLEARPESLSVHDFISLSNEILILSTLKKGRKDYARNI